MTTNLLPHPTEKQLAHPIKKIMVGLDFTIMDQLLIRYLYAVIERLAPTKIYFIHVKPVLNVPKDVKIAFPQLKEPQEKQLKNAMKKEVETVFKKKSVQFDIAYTITEGAPITQITQHAATKNIDLLIVGRKNDLKGSGIVPQQLARQLSCSVLFVPEMVAQTAWDEILVPVDFSDFAKNALELAIYYSQNHPDTTIYCQHIYDLPSGFYLTEKSKEEMCRSLKNFYTDGYNDFIKLIDLEDVHLKPIFTCDKNHNTANLVLDTAHKTGAKLIIVGAHGKNWVNRLLLGSFTEKLIQNNGSVPLLVVKKRMDRT